MIKSLINQQKNGNEFIKILVNRWNCHNTYQPHFRYIWHLCQSNAVKNTINKKWTLTETDMVCKIVTQLKHHFYTVSKDRQAYTYDNICSFIQFI